jgi:hypothetical protein
MKISEAVPTDYVANVVACKLWGLTQSAPESIFAQAFFKKLNHRYLGVFIRRISASIS